MEKVHFGDIKNLDRKSVIASTVKGRISPPATPDLVSSIRSRQTSTDNTSEIAQEIVVWTEEMDVDSASQHESDDSSELSIHEE